MNCICWIANEINRNWELIDADELFYEKEHNEFVEEVNVSTIPEKESEKLYNLGNIHLESIAVNPSVDVDNYVISHEFVGEGSSGMYKHLIFACNVKEIYPNNSKSNIQKMAALRPYGEILTEMTALETAFKIYARF